MKTVTERFLTYVKHHTTSDEDSRSFPSTKNQLTFAAFLAKECEAIGLQSVFVDEYGYVTATLPGTMQDAPTIGFIAHMDTSPDASGADIHPRIVHDYDGADIWLNESVVLSPKEYDNLLNHLHEDLIVTDGTTLLGADDKAGIAIIMNFVETLLSHPNMLHGDIGIAFTCDEEVGRGAENFDFDTFGCDYAYTVDGGDIHVIAYENFNAYEAIVNIQGKSIHPGSAKGKMINAALVGIEFNQCLNPLETPQTTSGYEGFHHLVDFHGQCEQAVLTYILRDHDESKLMKKIEDFKIVEEYLNKKYGYEMIHIDFVEQYKNMRSYIEKDMRCVEKAQRALNQCSLDYYTEAIRGGTDGAVLTYQGLNCPNLGTGGENFHGKYEYVSIQNMEKMVEVLLNIVSE